MKKLEYNNHYKGNDIDKIYANQFEMTEKQNEIVEWINHKDETYFVQPKKLEDNCIYPGYKKLEVPPQGCTGGVGYIYEKKLEVKHGRTRNSYNFHEYTDKENEVIKKCLKYCNHRMFALEHRYGTGIHKALNGDDVKTFKKIIKKL